VPPTCRLDQLMSCRAQGSLSGALASSPSLGSSFSLEGSRAGMSGIGATLRRMPTASVPERERPTIPDGYGLPSTADGLLSWDAVEQRLRASLHYWLATVRPDGSPHSVPRWGVWLDGCFYYDGAPTTRHVRNLDTNPACTLTLESGTDVVIVEGLSTATSAEPAELGARLSSAFEG